MSQIIRKHVADGCYWLCLKLASLKQQVILVWTYAVEQVLACNPGHIW